MFLFIFLRRCSTTTAILGVLVCGTALAEEGDGTLLWEFPVGGSMSFCPAIDEDGVVYLSAPDQNVHALNGETGEVLWSYPTELGLSSAPVLGSDGTVYVGLADTNIVALNGDTGDLL
jgi:outer membrane protein assembly factor BamB